MVSFVTFSSEDGYDKLWLKNYWKFRYMIACPFFSKNVHVFIVSGCVCVGYRFFSGQRRA